jgi:hypothetical protein
MLLKEIVEQTSTGVLNTVVKSEHVYCSKCGFINRDTITCRCGECWHYTNTNACAGTTYEFYDTIPERLRTKAWSDAFKFFKESND